MDKIKNILLAGVVAVSLAVFGVVYYMKLTDTRWENVGTSVLAESGSGGDEEEEEEEDDGDENEEEAEADREDEEDEAAEEAAKEAEKVKKEEEKKAKEAEKKEEESNKKSSSNSGSEKNESVSKSKSTGAANTTRTTTVEKVKVKEDDEDEEDDDDDDQDEVEDDEDEEEGEGTTVTKEVITNEDGTITRRQTLLKKDGRKKVIEHTFDANNKLVSKKKSEVRSDKGEEKVEVESFDVYGEKISEYKMETKDGKRIEIKKKGIGQESKLKFDAEKQELMVKVKEGEENEAKAFLRVKADENSTKIKLTRSGVIANSNFPITVDDETGKVYVKTPFKEVELKQMPDVIVEKAKQSQELDIVEDTTLSDENKPAYTLKGKRFEKFLGFYTVEIPSEVTYDADTGAKIKSEVPGIKRILSWFSF